MKAPNFTPETSRLANARKAQYRLEGRYVKRAKPLPLWPTAWAYIAGILDGEGSIGLASHTQPYALCPTVRVVNTHHGLIGELGRLLGGGTRCHLAGRPNQRSTWRWECSGTLAYEVLRRALPYLIVKRAHAEAILSARQGPALNGPEARAHNLAIRERIRQLNHRGSTPSA
jgi:hypothetical protein